MPKRSLALLLMCLGALAAWPVMAQADTQDIIQPQNETRDQGFQAGTCIAEGVAGPPPAPCSPETPTIFFKTAGGHPPIGFTQYIIEHEPFTPLPSPPFPAGSLLAPIPGEDIKEHTIRTLRVDLPPGLTVNPEATPRCSIEDFTAGAPGAMVPLCDPESKVGVEKITLVTNQNEVEIAPGFKPPEGFVIPPQKELTEVDVFNLEPDFGEPAKFGFVVRKAIPIYLETEVAWENDYHESFTIKLPNTAEATGLSTLISRLVNFGESGDGTYITNPTTCFDPNQAEYSTLYSTWFRAESYADPEGNFPQGYTAVEAKLPKDESGERVKQEGCGTVPFDPSVEVDAGTDAVDSPAAATVTTKLPFDPATEGGKGQMQSHVRKAEVALPDGMGLNPAGAQGLVACADHQFKKGVRTYENECPAGSDIGDVEVDSPPLAHPLKGDVYVGVQQSRNPESGNLFRILIEAKSEEEGIAARLVGRVKANGTTGNLTAEIYDDLNGQFTDQPAGLPQVPFEEIRLQFDGSKNTLTSPPICSSEGTSLFEPWARPGTTESAKSSVTLTSDPTGGSCPKTMAERKFAPTYVANVDNRKAGAYSPYTVRIARRDGQQELKVVDAVLPKGLTGKLAGIPYCPDGSIVGAIAKSGYEERANPSCSGASYIGKVITRSGAGNNPLELEGATYLAGPYRGADGADLSLVTITPAMAGPFDLGTVVVRVALDVDPETAQIHAISDAIPDVFGGVKLDLRAIDLRLDRDKFMLNPTNCYYQETTGHINGGGADPTNPAAFSSYPIRDPFLVAGCGSLGFKPNLKVQLFGPTRRAKNPRLKATFTAREGEANIGRLALRLPRALFLEQSHIGTVCTRPQLASNTCPKASVYGKAWARSPLLGKALKGKVYLVSSDNELPDLLVDLRGQVKIHLRGVISGKGGGLKTVFHETPDVPVSKFVLNMRGGEKSLLVNSENICKKQQRAFLNMRGWNNKKIKTNKFKLNIASCGKKKGKK